MTRMMLGFGAAAKPKPGVSKSQRQQKRTGKCAIEVLMVSSFGFRLSPLACGEFLPGRCSVAMRPAYCGRRPHIFPEAASDDAPRRDARLEHCLFLRCSSTVRRAA